MRHGEASHQCITSNSSDSLRPLTKNGELEAKATGLWLAHSQKLTPKIFVSPYLRAQQTCSLVVNVLSENGLAPASEPTTLEFITPSGDAQQVHDFIDGLLASSASEIEAILLVSHMPFVSYLVAQLTQSQHMPIFATAAIAQINYDTNSMQGQLVSLVSPDKI